MSCTKKEIILLTTKRIQQKSFTSFSYDDLAKEMNITKAAIHYHFKRKEDLAVAVCDFILEVILECYEYALEKVKNKDGNPWLFFEKRLQSIGVKEICPILSLQPDFEHLSEKVKDALKKVNQNEVALFSDLIHNYAPSANADRIAVVTAMSIKGAFTYRRVLGEAFFESTMETIKEQFLASLKGKLLFCIYFHKKCNSSYELGHHFSVPGCLVHSAQKRSIKTWLDEFDVSELNHKTRASQ